MNLNDFFNWRSVFLQTVLAVLARPRLGTKRELRETIVKARKQLRHSEGVLPVENWAAVSASVQHLEVADWRTEGGRPGMEPALRLLLFAALKKVISAEHQSGRRALFQYFFQVKSVHDQKRGSFDTLWADLLEDDYDFSENGADHLNLLLGHVPFHNISKPTDAEITRWVHSTANSCWSGLLAEQGFESTDELHVNVHELHEEIDKAVKGLDFNKLRTISHLAFIPQMIQKLRVEGFSLSSHP